MQASGHDLTDNISSILDLKITLTFLKLLLQICPILDLKFTTLRVFANTVLFALQMQLLPSSMVTIDLSVTSRQT